MCYARSRGRHLSTQTYCSRFLHQTQMLMFRRVIYVPPILEA